MGFLRRLSLLLILMLGGISPGVALAQVDVSEYELKAAFVYQFATYAEWPPEAFESDDTPLRFGVLGSELMANNLEILVEGQRLNGRLAEVRLLQHGDSLAGLHVLFIGSAEQAAALLAEVPVRPLLTVTETEPERWPPGSMINLQVVDEHVRLDVALPATNAAGLRLSARLLQVAQRVLPSP